MEKVKVYRNLHQKCWSIKEGKYPVEHGNFLSLKNCRLRVQPAGRERVLREKKKNVHAFIHGEKSLYYFDPFDITEGGQWWQIKYNPYEAPYFRYVDMNRPIHFADIITCLDDGRVFAFITK